MDLKSIILEEIPTDDLQGVTDSIREHPSQLVKKRIKHKFFNEEIGCEQWYEGHVLSFSKSTKKYCVKYDGEDSICYFLLDEVVEDVLAKDLFIL